MRYLRSTIIGMAVFAMVVSLSGLAFAEMGKFAHKGGMMDKDACAAQIKTLRDSAMALQTSNPACAGKIKIHTVVKRATDIKWSRHIQNGFSSGRLNASR